MVSISKEKLHIKKSKLPLEENLLPPITCMGKRVIEHGERLVAAVWTDKNACVLEFGGGSGSVSMEIQRRLSDPYLHTVIQPDGKGSMFGGLDALKKTKKDCSANFNIVDHILQAGEGEKIQSLVSRPYDTIVADCEGCLVEEFNKNPNLFSHVKMIQVERDDSDYSYTKLFRDTLKMKHVATGNGCDGRCATEVWTRP